MNFKEIWKSVARTIILSLVPLSSDALFSRVQREERFPFQETSMMQKVIQCSKCSANFSHQGTSALTWSDHQQSGKKMTAEAIQPTQGLLQVLTVVSTLTMLLRILILKGCGSLSDL